MLCPPPGDLPDPGIKPTSLASPALVGGFFTAVPPEKPWASLCFGLILVALLASRHTVAVQSFNRVRLFEIPWTVALKASLSSTISWSLVRLMSIDLLMPSWIADIIHVDLSVSLLRVSFLEGRDLVCLDLQPSPRTPGCQDLDPRHPC